MTQNKSKNRSAIYSNLMVKRIIKIISTPRFGKVYLFVTLLILLLTTLFWTIKGAVLNLFNSDQLVDPYLFQNSATFHNTQFPGSHTFILKWPLFYLIKLFGFSSASYIIMTVFVVLLTVAVLVFILYKIERRPLVLGTLVLALASALLLTPAQPYPGGLLPVNMAMLETRNIEYALYILSLYLFVRSPKIKTKEFWLGVLLLTFLIASDKIFFAISFGGSILAILFYSLVKKWKLVSMSARWLLGSVIATIGSVLLLWLIVAGKITNIVNQSSAGPYGYVRNLHDIILGTIYSITGLFTNFGANPSHNTTILHKIPGEVFSNLFSVAGLSYVINIIVLLVGLFCIYKIISFSFSNSRRSLYKFNSSYQVLIALVFSTVAAFLIFIISNHDYSVDARYLSIVLFTIFIAIALFVQKKKFKPEYLILGGIILIISIILGIFGSNVNYQKENTAISQIKTRNLEVSYALKHRDGNVLVGDYWRVLPIKQQTNKNLVIDPLGSCTHGRIGLSSSTWHFNLNKHGFEYLLTLDGSLTNYPNCTLNQIITAYGHPNASTLIAGTLNNPQELLLHYDNGAHVSGPIKKTGAQTNATVTPISINDTVERPCDRPTVMTFIAHQDDDLLFMNPDTLHAIQDGSCIRTVYLTAGDGGYNDRYYWLGREQGAEAAYAYMSPGISSTWEERIVKITNNEFITIANPRGNAKISLIFIRLPDGNLKGEGFKSNNFESLANLDSGTLGQINSVDSQSAYSKVGLISALDSIMHLFQPSEIHTQANFVSSKYPDHSDHMAVGRLIKKAYAQYETEQFNNQVSIPIKYYVGYPVHAFAPNVLGQDLQNKASAYLIYAKYDSTVCKTLQQCDTKSSFGTYINKQYTNPY